ncbi:MAG TPA: hypothetical protein VGJ79_14320 [Candidatus Dormibacteraeota bacterium]
MRGSTISALYVLDVEDPLRPVQVCQLLNAAGGRFISATKIEFWYSTFVGTVDLETGNLNWSRAWVDPPIEVEFSPDGASWAYRKAEVSGVSTHLVVGGKDVLLLNRRLIGAEVGPVWGPVDQLAFSATGQFLLTYTLFAAPDELPNFVVFALDGSIGFKNASAKFGTWDRSGDRLYFLAATTAAGIAGAVKSLDPGGQPVARSPKLTSYFWPTLSPDGRTLVFDTYGAQQFPHPWRLDIASRVKTQLSSATSTQPVFTAPLVIWSNEGIPCKCAPRGTSAPDGRVIAHNLKTGVNSVVLEIATVDQRQDPTADIVDVWFG